MEDPARGDFVPALESCLMSRTKRISGVEKSLKFCRAIDPRLLSACRSVFEQLEQRQMLSTTTVQTLPFNLDFGADRGELTDKDGQGTGFTRVQANTAGNQYQPGLINLDPTAGVLTLTTNGPGTNSGTSNTQLNALETQFN